MRILGLGSVVMLAVGFCYVFNAHTDLYGMGLVIFGAAGVGIILGDIAEK